MLFYQQLDRFGDHPALIDAENKHVVTYSELELLIQARASDLAGYRKLVFIEVRNDIESLVSYLTCLRQEHVVYLLDSIDDPKTKTLVEAYQPNLLISPSKGISLINDQPHTLHPDLRLLLSTSGSTGTPKFVKLSERNIQSNAEAIAEYLQITKSERAYAHLKPYYSYGMSVINSHLSSGAALILTSRSITEPEFLEQIKDLKATSFAGVPYTFEMLLHLHFKIEDYPDLHTMTQAGGKLEPHLVSDYAKRCQTVGKRFVVMYGQTEAAPRISYLPSNFAEKYPSSIGIAIPGGKLSIVDNDKNSVTAKDTPGELTYRGPNVMMGYASQKTHLASDETPDFLYTGDIAYQNSEGLFFIVGRTSRFVKLFGLRINLDQIQSDLKRQHANIVVTGDDKHIVVALLNTAPVAPKEISQHLAQTYHLPETSFILITYDEIPLLPNGKYDFQRIIKDATQPPKTPWFTKIIQTITDVLELNERSWGSIADIYREILSRQEINPSDSFDSLGADSLSYVSLSIEMENALHDALPANWRAISVSDLDAIYFEKRSTA